MHVTTHRCGRSCLSATEGWWCPNRPLLWTRRRCRLLVLRLLRLSRLLILLHHIEVVDGVLMLLRLYALLSRLSIIDRLLGGSLLSSCHSIEADAQATAATGAGNHCLLHTLEVVDL